MRSSRSCCSASRSCPSLPPSSPGASPAVTAATLGHLSDRWRGREARTCAVQHGTDSREGAPLVVCRAAPIAPWPCLAIVPRHHASMPAWWSGGACAQHQVVAWCGSDCRRGAAGCPAWSRTRCCTGSRSRSCCAVHAAAHAMWRRRKSQICNWHAQLVRTNAVCLGCASMSVETH